MKKIVAIALLLFASTLGAQESYLQVPPDSTGKKLRMRSNTVSSQTVYTQDFFLSDGSGGGPLGINANPIFVNFVAGATTAITAASLPLPAGAATEATLAGIKTGTDKIPASPSTDRTTAGAPFSMRLSDGSAFIDPRDVSDRAGRQLGVIANTGFNVNNFPANQAVTNQQTNVTADYDSGGGTQNLTVFGIALPKSGGAVAGGTSSDPIRIDPTGTTTQPISAASLPLPSGAAQDRTTAGTPFAVRWSNGSAFIAPPTAAADRWFSQITDGTNSATVTAGGLLNVNCASGCSAGGSFSDSTAFTFGTTAVGNMSAVVDDTSTNTVAENSAGAVRMSGSRILYVDLSKTAANTTAIKVDGSAVTQPVSGTITANAGSGTFTISGTVTANAGTGTLAVDQTDTAAPDYDTGGATVAQVVVGLALPGAGGPVAGGTSSNPIRTDPTGSTTQPVSGTVTANAGSGTFTISGTVTANAGTGTMAVDQTDTAAPDYDSGGGTVAQAVVGLALPGAGGPVAGGTSANPVRTDPTGSTTQPVSGTVTANAGTGTFTVSGTVTANAGTGTMAVDQTDTAAPDYDSGGGTVAQAVVGLALPGAGGPVAGGTSANPVRTDPTGSTTQPVSGTVTANAGTGTFTVSGTVTANAGTGTMTVAGAKTNNNAAPGATNVGTLPAVATANAPSFTEGNQVGLSTDLAGGLRIETKYGGAHSTTAPGDAAMTGAYVESDAAQLDSASNVEGDITRNKSDVEGRQLVRTDHPNRFVCGFNAIAATLTQCQAAAGAGLHHYIQTLTIQTTTATSGTYAIQVGTGTNCGTGTAALFPISATGNRFNAPITSQAMAVIKFDPPLRTPSTAQAICVIGVATNTVSGQIFGFTAAP